MKKFIKLTKIDCCPIDGSPDKFSPMAVAVDAIVSVTCGNGFTCISTDCCVYDVKESFKKVMKLINENNETNW